MVEQSLAQKIYKMEVNIKTCHLTYDVSRNFNSKGKCISGLYVEQNLKVTVLYPTFNSITGPAPGIVTSFSLKIVLRRVFFVIIDPTKSNYFYGKQVKAVDLTSFKVYIKRTI